MTSLWVLTSPHTTCTCLQIVQFAQKFSVDSLFVDVGANVGRTSFPIVCRKGVNHSVIAVEPVGAGLARRRVGRKLHVIHLDVPGSEAERSGHWGGILPVTQLQHCVRRFSTRPRPVYSTPELAVGYAWDGVAPRAVWRHHVSRASWDTLGERSAK